MGNKKNQRKLSKRQLKKLKIQAMATCRRTALAHSKITRDFECDPDESISRNLPSTSSASNLENIPTSNVHELFLQDKSAISPMENTVLRELDPNCDVPISTDRNIEPQVYNQARKQAAMKKKRKSEETIDENVYDASERLIIDKVYFFEKLKIISNHAPHFGCNLSNLNISGETKMGLNSKLKLSCDMCKATFFINTSDPHPDANLDINTAAVSGITYAGIGLEQFQGLCAAMNLPIMTQQMFDKKHNHICEEWEKTAHKTMALAAERERRAAVEEGRVKDGIAVIDVIADGCWSKRSYKTNYAALSGAAAIVGRKFGEVLFLGVKNKYCCICNRAENKGEAPKEHVCFKNYTGSSSGMEAEIITEGFKNSIDMYNLIYGRIIADGDSSTYSKILEARPYKGITVEKIECRNHILRNMCNKLAAVSKDTKYSLNMRKMLTTQRILAIRKVIISSIKKLKSVDVEQGVRINRLYSDISNSYYHSFGHHDDCQDYYCCSEKKSEDLVPIVKNSTFWAKIQYIVGLVATHSRSLINDCDSNAVEQFNSIIAKFVGGKRTNLIQRRTYQARCAAAVVAYNTKRPLYNVQKSLLGRSPKSKIKSFEEKRICKNKLRQKFKSFRHLCFYNKTSLPLVKDKNYGTDTCQKPDMAEDVYEMAKRSFLKNLEKTETERSEIERATILQRDSSEWLELRRNLLTASNFGRIIKRRPTTSASIVKTLLYKSDISNVVSIKHGIDNEAIALNQLAAQENIEISPCGLFIDSEIPFLAATPDGLIGNESIVEMKCPISAFKMPIDEAIKKKKIKFWDIKDNTRVINKNDSWYYQVQGQLHITRRKMCLFAVWSGENQNLTIENIFRDDDFWSNKMVGKLTEFYIAHLLPELIDPRHTRAMPLRQPTVSRKRPQQQQAEAGPSKKSYETSELVEMHNSDVATPSDKNVLEAGPSNPELVRTHFPPTLSSEMIRSLSPGVSTAGTYNVKKTVLPFAEY